MSDGPERTGLLLRTTYRLMVERVEDEFRDTGLGLSQWLALAAIGKEPTVCARDISNKLGIDAGAITRLLDKLEQRRLIDRHRSTSDRRVVEVAITPAGEEMVRALRARLSAFWEHSLGAISSDQSEQLNSLLARLIGAWSPRQAYDRPQPLCENA